MWLQKRVFRLIRLYCWKCKKKTPETEFFYRKTFLRQEQKIVVDFRPRYNIHIQSRFIHPFDIIAVIKPGVITSWICTQIGAAAMKQRICFRQLKKKQLIADWTVNNTNNHFSKNSFFLHTKSFLKTFVMSLSGCGFYP